MIKPFELFFPLAQETIDKLLNLADRGNWIWKDGKSRPPSPKRRRSPSPNEYIPVYNMGQGSRLPPQFPIKRSRTDSLIELSDNESIRSTKSSTKSYRNFEHEKGIFLRAAPKDKIIDAEDAHAYQVKSEFLSSALGSSLSLYFFAKHNFTAEEDLHRLWVKEKRDPLKKESWTKTAYLHNLAVRAFYTREQTL